MIGMRVLGGGALVVAAMAAAYGDGPPPAHTGGFGEPTCRVCHADRPADDPGGAAAILGVPETVEPGKTYAVRVAVTRPGLVRAGFQLAARSQRSDGSVTQAGAFLVEGPTVTMVRQAGIEYLQHAPDGTETAQPDTAVWTLTWTAPRDSDPIVFHLAANASNDDGSEFGDFIYLLEHRVRTRRR